MPVSAFSYNRVIVHEWVKASKVVLDPELNFKTRGTHGMRLRATMQIHPRGAPALFELVVNAGRVDMVDTYSSAVLVDHVKVRGVDFHPLPRTRFYRLVCPAGWHQDILDPVEGDERRENVEIEPLTDLRDFTSKVANLWNIQLPDLPSFL